MITALLIAVLAAPPAPSPLPPFRLSKLFVPASDALPTPQASETPPARVDLGPAPVRVVVSLDAETRALLTRILDAIASLRPRDTPGAHTPGGASSPAPPGPPASAMPEPPGRSREGAAGVESILPPTVIPPSPLQPSSPPLPRPSPQTDDAAPLPPILQGQPLFTPGLLRPSAGTKR